MSFDVRDRLAVAHGFRYAVVLATWFLLAGAPAGAQSPGFDAPPTVEPYFGDTFPLQTPGDGTEQTYRLVNAYPGLTFDDPLVYTPLPRSDRVFVASRGGIIHQFVNDPATATKELVLDIESITAVVWDGGFLGLAFHPRFGLGEGKDYMYVYHSARPEDGSYPGGSTGGFFGTYLRLARYDLDPVTLVADPQSELQMFNVRLYNGSHRGGGLTFGGDGMLYLSIGDQFRYETAQDIAGNFEGGIIRIDVDMDPTLSHPPRRFMGTDVGEDDEFTGVGYFIPNDNPFLDEDGAVFEEFWTLGNRAPHRMTYDAVTDRLWSGEVGQNRREEINIIEGGNNYGWPFREGLGDGVRAEPDSIGGTLTDPILDFSRSDARAIIGGYVYRGSALPELYGKYLCGDYIFGNLFAISYDDSTGATTREDLGLFTPGFLGTFGQDLDGEVYLCGLGPDRPIYRYERVVTNTPAPATLSETGFFSDLQALVPTDAAIPYEINVPFWSDGARKSRWILFPFDGEFNLAEERIGFSSDEPWNFPEGSVLVKHFDLPTDETDPAVTIPIETRFLVSGYLGEVYGLTYRWRADGSDADLVTGGDDVDYTIATATGTRTQTWRYPSNAECRQCHNPTAGFALGFSTRQLNRETTYPSTGRTDNQLVTYADVGMLDTSIVAGDAATMPRLAASDDMTRTLEDRARSYLDANCSHCHQSGIGNRAVFDARASVPLEEASLVRSPVFVDDLGVPEAAILSPQRPERSIAHRRMRIRDGGGVGMPPIASSVPDVAGARLVEDWIAVLDADYTVNVALGRPATQDGTQSGRGAGRAVDGSTDGVLSNGSVSETARRVDPWWEVDLESDYAIDIIRIWNRTDCCQNRLSDITVFVSDTPFGDATFTEIQADSLVTEIFLPGTVQRSVEVPVGVSGRYVRIQRDTNNQQYLNLAEVQVFSDAWTDPPIEIVSLGNAPFGADQITADASNLVVNLSDGFRNADPGFALLRADRVRFEAATVSSPVTPFLATFNGSRSLRVVAIGSTRLPEEMVVGTNEFAFDAIAPSVVRVRPGERIVGGFLEARADGSDGGLGAVVAFSADAAQDSVYWTGGDGPEDGSSLVVGETIVPGRRVEQSVRRDYAFEVEFTRMLEPDDFVVDAGTPSAPGGRLQLAMAAPNPFNPRTVLRLRLDRTSHVDWALFDVRGRRVVTLASGPLAAGEHVRVWDGVDQRGVRVSSGVYFQRATGDGEIHTNKVVLTK